jgi:hypothetical protein
VIRHEGSHAIAVIMGGGEITKFIVLPSMLNDQFVWGFVKFAGKVPLFAEYAPYIANLISVLLGFSLLRYVIKTELVKVSSHSIVIIFIALIFFPILNTLYNYVGGLRGHGDFINVFETYGFINVSCLLVLFIVVSLIYAIRFIRSNKPIFVNALIGNSS